MRRLMPALQQAKPVRSLVMACPHQRQWAKLIALAFGALLFSTGVQAQYKCKAADGAVTFQQTPCAASEQQERLRHAAGSASEPASGPPKDGQSAQAKLAELERRLRIREAINVGRPMVGMTQDELSQALGSPDRTNTGQYGGSQQDQLIYYRNGRTVYVYTRDGVVTAIQDQDGGKGAAPPKPCPSAREIRDIEMDISKIANRDNPQLQAELHKRLHDAKACR